MPQPYIVCCSAYTDDIFIEEAYAVGMDKFYTKPVNAGQLIDLVKDVLSKPVQYWRDKWVKLN